jgi:hypothetical protein
MVIGSLSASGAVASRCPPGGTTKALNRAAASATARSRGPPEPEPAPGEPAPGEAPVGDAAPGDAAPGDAVVPGPAVCAAAQPATTATHTATRAALPDAYQNIPLGRRAGPCGCVTASGLSVTCCRTAVLPS